MFYSAIVAMSQNRVIGKNNRIPWHLPDDLRYFKKVTSGHSIVMGRKTFESIGRPLPHRENIVISRQRKLVSQQGVQLFHSVNEVTQYCSTKGENEEVFVIGGAEIYRTFFPKLHRIYLTLIHHHFDGDTFFPAFENENFSEIWREDHAEPLPYSFLVFERKSETGLT